VIGIGGVAAAVTLALPAVPIRLIGLGVVEWLLVFFAVVGHLTALQRFRGAWSDL
jgi:archaetidylinositol phosphate synthase